MSKHLVSDDPIFLRFTEQVNAVRKDLYLAQKDNDPLRIEVLKDAERMCVNQRHLRAIRLGLVEPPRLGGFNGT